MFRLKTEHISERVTDTRGSLLKDDRKYSREYVKSNNSWFYWNSTSGNMLNWRPCAKSLCWTEKEGVALKIDGGAAELNTIYRSSLTFKVDERICMGHLPRFSKANTPRQKGIKIFFFISLLN